MADLFGSFGGMFAGFANLNWMSIMIWTLFFIALCGTILFVFFFILIKKREIPIIEIDLMNKRINPKIKGVLKKDNSNNIRLWLKGIKKFVEKPQQADYYFTKKKDSLLLLKDNNGLHHPLRIPSYEEMTKFYAAQGMNIETDNPHLKEIFLMPNPHEDLEWLANQCIEAHDEFKSQKWWQHPTVMVLGAIALWILFAIVFVVLEKKLV